MDESIIANGVFDGGSGTADSPYVITTVSQLKAVSNYPSAYFILEADITEPLTTILCNSKSPFKGNFNGNGHMVTVSITNSTEHLVGLFSCNLSGTISNLHVSGTITLTCMSALWSVNESKLNLEDIKLLSEDIFSKAIDMSTYAAAGGITGYNKGTITDCTSAVTVSATSSIKFTGLGGIAGYNAGIITSCTSSSSVLTSSTFDFAGLGGIAGCNEGKISSCKSSAELSTSGSVINSIAAGGLVGYNDSIVSSSSATATVSPSSAIKTICEGGLIGYTDKKSIVSDSFASGIVTTDSASGNVHKGGLIGYGTEANISGCSASGEVPSSTATDDQLTEGGLIGFVSKSTVSNCHAIGNVTGGTGNRTAIGGLIGWNEETDVSDCYATGTVYTPCYNYYLWEGGLVGFNRYSTIDTCYAQGDVSGSGDNADIGGLVGYCLSMNDVDENNKPYIVKLALVKNSYASGNVTCSNAYAGGLIGYVKSSNMTCLPEVVFGVIECYATGNVTQSSGKNTIEGGLIGLMCTVSAQKCFYTGTVKGFFNVGGIAGSIDCDSILDNCYSTGDIYGSLTGAYLGGLIGSLGANTSTARYCYAAGKINGINAVMGGLVGYVVYTLSDCCWNTDLTENSVGYAVNSGTVSDNYGLTTDQMTGDSAETNMACLDFTSIWQTKSNSTEGGVAVRYYPQLSAFANSTSSDIKAASLKSVTVK